MFPGCANHSRTELAPHKLEVQIFAKTYFGDENGGPTLSRQQSKVRSCLACTVVVGAAPRLHVLLHFGVSV